jgi:hypothetical protein
MSIEPAIRWRKKNIELVRLRDRIRRKKEYDADPKGWILSHKKWLNTPKSRFRKYKAVAKREGHFFNLTFEEFSRFWNNSCEYCGDGIDGIGLDRVDSTKGYFIDNVAACCLRCNIMKNKYDREDFLSRCRKIAAKWPERREII